MKHGSKAEDGVALIVLDIKRLPASQSAYKIRIGTELDFLKQLSKRLQIARCLPYTSGLICSSDLFSGYHFQQDPVAKPHMSDKMLTGQSASNHS